MVEANCIIDGRRVGVGQPCFVIAEAGVNHNGSLETACRMIRKAAQSGADAVKFQTFKSERLVTAQAAKARYQVEATGRDESQLEMLRKLELSPGGYPVLMKECRDNHILFMSSPFDEESADMLDAFGLGVFKIASGEITNFPLLNHIGHMGKAMILSTGMSYLSEVDSAVRMIFETGNRNLALLHCTSNYPARPADINLRAMQTMARAFQLPVGFSDHSQGIEIALGAVALGAAIIEKHFTLDRAMPGPDQKASLEPDELAALVRGIRKVEASLGNGVKQPVESEADVAAVARKSLSAKRMIPAGETLTASDLVVLRPGTGLPPSMLPYVVGRVARVDIPQGVLISLEMLA